MTETILVTGGCGFIGFCFVLQQMKPYRDIHLINLIHLFLHVLAAQTGKPEEDYTKPITFVPDHPRHDRRYAVECVVVRKLERHICQKGNESWQKTIVGYYTSCADVHTPVMTRRAGSR